jgi:hypothetical protein
MAKIAYKKSLMDTNITILSLQNFFLMDSVNVQIYKIDICKHVSYVEQCTKDIGGRQTTL